MLHSLEHVRDHQNPLAGTPTLVSCQAPQLGRPRFAAEKVCRHPPSPKHSTLAYQLYHIWGSPEAGITGTWPGGSSPTTYGQSAVVEAEALFRLAEIAADVGELFELNKIGTPPLASRQACPGSEQEGPARVAQCPHERQSGARGRACFAHRGKPGWYSGAVFEAPALVAGFGDFTMMGQPVEQRGCRRPAYARSQLSL